MSSPRDQATDGQPWPDTQPAPLAPAGTAPPTLAQVVRRYRQATAAAPAAPIKGLEVSEIESDTAFDRLFGPDTRPADGLPG